MLRGGKTSSERGDFSDTARPRFTLIGKINGRGRRKIGSAHHTFIEIDR
jgi:hypothetical protein